MITCRAKAKKDPTTTVSLVCPGELSKTAWNKKEVGGCRNVHFNN